MLRANGTHQAGSKAQLATPFFVYVCFRDERTSKHHDGARLPLYDRSQQLITVSRVWTWGETKYTGWVLPVWSSEQILKQKKFVLEHSVWVKFTFWSSFAAVHTQVWSNLVQFPFSEAGCIHVICWAMPPFPYCGRAEFVHIVCIAPPKDEVGLPR